MPKCTAPVYLPYTSITNGFFRLIPLKEKDDFLLLHHCNFLGLTELTAYALFSCAFLDHSWSSKSGHSEGRQTWCPREWRCSELLSGPLDWLCSRICHKSACPEPTFCGPRFYASEGEVYFQFQMSMVLTFLSPCQTLESYIWTFWAIAYVLLEHDLLGCFCPCSENCSPLLHSWK